MFNDAQVSPSAPPKIAGRIPSTKFTSPIYATEANLRPVDNHTFEITIEYVKQTPQVLLKCALTALITLEKLTDRSEYTDGVHEAAYGELWLGKHTAKIYREERDRQQALSADGQTITWERQWYDNPGDALMVLVYSDPEVFLSLERDHLGVIPLN